MLIPNKTFILNENLFSDTQHLEIPVQFFNFAPQNSKQWIGVGGYE
jgi:hypothetical protein